MVRCKNTMQISERGGCCAGERIDGLFSMGEHRAYGDVGATSRGGAVMGDLYIFLRNNQQQQTTNEYYKIDKIST